MRLRLLARGGIRTTFMPLRRLALLLIFVAPSIPSTLSAQRDTLTLGRWRGEITPANNTPYGA